MQKRGCLKIRGAKIIVTLLATQSNKHLLCFHGIWINLSLKNVIDGSEKTSSKVTGMNVTSKLGMLSVSLTIHGVTERTNDATIAKTAKMMPRKRCGRTALFLVGVLLFVASKTSVSRNPDHRVALYIALSFAVCVLPVFSRYVVGSVKSSCPPRSENLLVTS